MGISHAKYLAPMLALAVSLSGCASVAPWNPLAKHRGPAPAQLTERAAPKVPLSHRIGNVLKPTTPGTSVVPASSKDSPGPQFASSAPNTTVSPAGHSITSGFRKAASAVGDALTIKPKVEVANDPTLLSSNPGKIGPEVYVSAAGVFEQQGNFDRAADHYEKALELAPQNRMALIGYGRLLHRQGKLGQAVDIYQRAVQDRDDDPVALNDLGLCYARMGRRDEALRALSSAVAIDSDSKLYRNNLATLLVQANRLDEALQQLTHAHGEAAAHYNLGYLLKKRGDQALATRHFEKALQISPAFAPARDMLAHMTTPVATVARTPAAPPSRSEHAPPPPYDTSDVPSQHPGQYGQTDASPTSPSDHGQQPYWNTSSGNSTRWTEASPPAGAF